MIVHWVTSTGEVEGDMTRIPDSEALRLRVWPIGTGDWAANFRETPWNWVRLRDSTTKRGLLETLEFVAREPADLIVFRYPAWINANGIREEFDALFRDKPVVAWMSEQGATLYHAMKEAVFFDRVAVNNRLEMPAYAREFPKKRLYYLPHGCVPGTAAPRPEYEADLVADGGAHYACGDEAGAKRDSVEVMVRPWFGTPWRLALWGSSDPHHGWPGVPGLDGQFRGAYPPGDTAAVYASTRVYLGISWNWRLGGYGVKLARALGAGVATIWHRTPGMDLDGLAHGDQLLMSSSPDETLSYGVQLLRDERLRRELAERGRRFAEAHWNWERNLVRLAEEVQRGG